MLHHRRVFGFAVLLVAVPVALLAQTQEGAPRAARNPSSGGYAGSAVCAECHADAYRQFAGGVMGKVMLDRPRTNHEKLGCESCHGPAKDHADSGGDERNGMITYGGKKPSGVEARNKSCIGCHESSARLYWKGSTHEGRGVACTDCHTVMHEVSERANLARPTVLETCGGCHKQQKVAQTRFAHMPLGEGKMECTSCHNPHGSPNPKLLQATSTNETCFSCHAEKRGPYLWQHMPVTESCANCHDPHGTNHEKMLKVARPRLCQQCHAGATRHPTAPRNTTYATQAQYMYNRQCQNCHVAIHGSNHPSANGLTR